MDTKIKVGIVGAAGYTGGELLRLLINHPYVEIEFALSRTFDGKTVSSVHTDLLGETELVFTSTFSNSVDVLFLCLPHKESAIWIKNTTIDANIKIIDLGNGYQPHYPAPRSRCGAVAHAVENSRRHAAQPGFEKNIPGFQLLVPAQLRFRTPVFSHL